MGGNGKRHEGRLTQGLVAWVLVLLAMSGSLVALAETGIVGPTDRVMLAVAVAVLFATAVATNARLGSLRSATVGSWPVARGAVAVAGALALSAAASSQPWTAVFGAPGLSLGALQMIALLALVVASAYLSTRLRSVLKAAAGWLIVVQLTLVAYQLLTDHVPAGGLSNSTFLSQVLLLMLPIHVGPRIASGSRDGTVTASVAGLAVVAALWLSGSRAGFLLGLLGLVLSAAAARLVRGAGRRSPAEGSERRIALSSAAMAMTLAGSPAALALSAPNVLLSARDSLGLGVRPELWGGALRLWLESPLLGIGPDAFRVAVARIAPPAMMTLEGHTERSFASVGADPHSALLFVLCAGGVLLAAAAGWMVREVVRNWVLQWRAGSREHVWFAIAAVLYAATTLLAPAPLQTAALAALVLGASLRPEHRSKAAGDEKRAALTVTGSWLLAALVAVTLAAHSATRLYVGPWKDVPSVADAARAQRAADLWHVDPFLHYWSGQVWAVVGHGDPATGGAGHALSAASRASGLEPENPFFALAEAQVQTLFAPADAVDTFEKVLVLFPNSWEAHYDYARLLHRLHRTEDALTHVRHAKQLAPGSMAVSDLHAVLSASERRP